MLKKLASKFAARLQRRIGAHLKKFNFVRTITISGVDVRIPSINGIACDLSEPWMIDLLAVVLLEQNGTFLDVGVNTGQTLVKVKSLQPERSYIGFEPNSACSAYVQALITENSYDRCVVIPVGIFTHDGVLSLDLFSSNAADSSASLIEEFRPGQKVLSRVLVPVFRAGTLGRLLGEESIGVVKIDVEGSELEVVTSLRDVIDRDGPILVLEVLPVYSQENLPRLCRQLELERILTEMGYALLRVRKTAAGGFAGLHRVDSIGIHSDLAACDYVAVPISRVARIASSAMAACRT